MALIISTILLWFTQLFHSLPTTILAAIVIVAVVGLVEVAEVRYLFRVKSSDGFTFLLTFQVSLGFGVEWGIIDGYAERDIAVAFSGMKGPVRDLAERAGWPLKYGGIVGYLSLQQAVSELRR